MSYHGKDPEQAQWVLDTFGTPEKQEFYKGNKGYFEWLEQCRQIVEARRIDY